MKIRQEILDKIDNPQSRTRIAIKLGCGEQALAVQLRRNNENGRLTKMDALQAIAEESGYRADEILENEQVSNG